jgi:hypothetical protein
MAQSGHADRDGECPLCRQLVGWQVDHKSKRVLTRSFLGGPHDVIFGIAIEVALKKRRWIK